MKTALIAAILGFVVSATVSMYNLKIGDAQSALSKIDLQVDAKEGDMIKYITKDGNHFSVTCENGKIVYMENDWLQNPDSSKPLVSNFEFGKTTLADIRKTFDNNGFFYENHQPFLAGEHVILFNCYELAESREVLIVVTKLKMADDVTEENLAGRAKLDAVIIADSDYLERTWGSEKIFDPGYKKIKL